MQTYKTSKSKENILRKIRAALQENPVPMPYPEVAQRKPNTFFHPAPMPSREENFAVAFSENGGQFVFCKDEEEAIDNLNLLVAQRGWTEVLCAQKQLFSFLIHHKLPYIREFNVHNELAVACITDCEAAVADTGSLLLTHRNQGRIASSFYPVHIVLLFAHQIVDNIDEALAQVKKKYKGRMPSTVSLHTGCSATNSIEQKLIKGGQGAQELFCFFLNQS